MFNFCDPRLKPAVKCSCVSEDDYPVENLINKTALNRNNGFMAFNVTKPPVDITFDFSYKCSIDHIKIWTSIGSLKSTGFEILVKHEDNYIKVAKISNFEADIAIVRRPCKEEHLNSNILFFSSREVNRVLNNANGMLIMITSTRKCAPVVNRVEVWGEPSLKLSESERQQICRAWNQNSIIEIEKDAEENILETKIQTNLTVPETFLDAITCEIMVFPMTLPCGKVIDQSTIDRHSHVEEMWGRVPSDPFTGIIFTSEKKPILDLSLKACIEKFLIENANHPEYKNLPRTVGSIAKKRKIDEITSSTSTATLFGTNCQTNFNSTEKIVPSQSPLEAAIKNALKNITRFSIPKPKEPQIDENACYKCRNIVEQMYFIRKCTHKLCRTCLKQCMDLKLCQCGIDIDSADVSRIHK